MAMEYSVAASFIAHAPAKSKRRPDWSSDPESIGRDRCGFLATEVQHPSRLSSVYMTRKASSKKVRQKDELKISIINLDMQPRGLYNADARHGYQS